MLQLTLESGQVVQRVFAGFISSQGDLEKATKEIASEVISVGEQAKLYNAPHPFESNQEAIDYLLSKMTKDDIIFIKASNSCNFVEIVEGLKN